MDNRTIRRILSKNITGKLLDMVCEDFENESEKIVSFEVLDDYFNKQSINTSLDTQDWYLTNENDHKECIIKIIAGGSNGTCIPQIVCKELEINECLNVHSEYYLDDFVDIEMKIQECIDDFTSDIPNCQFYIGHSDSDGDYCLFATKPIKKYEALFIGIDEPYTFYDISHYQVFCQIENATSKKDNSLYDEEIDTITYVDQDGNKIPVDLDCL